MSIYCERQKLDLSLNSNNKCVEINENMHFKEKKNENIYCFKPTFNLPISSNMETNTDKIKTSDKEENINKNYNSELPINEKDDFDEKYKKENNLYKIVNESNIKEEEENFETKINSNNLEEEKNIDTIFFYKPDEYSSSSESGKNEEILKPSLSNNEIKEGNSEKKNELLEKNYYIDIDKIKKAQLSKEQKQDQTTTSTDKIKNNKVKKGKKKKKKKIAKKNKLFDIPISDIYFNSSYNKDLEIDKYVRIKKIIIYSQKPTFKIPINDIKKEKEKEKINENNNIINNLENNNINIENINKNQRTNPNIGINSGLLNHFNFNNVNYIDFPFGFNNNFNGYFAINDYKNLIQLSELKIKIETLKKIGLNALMNPENPNHYIFNMIYKNNINNINNYFNNNFNQFSPLNNNINYGFSNFNNFGNQYPFFNYFPNPNIMNMNNNMFIKNNPEKYTITFKSKTNDPSIEKISKIQVITSYVKDNSKIKQENKDTKKEKNKQNLINLEDIKSGKEKRTVVRLNPIPPNYSSFDVSKLIDKYLNIENGKKQRIYRALYTPLCKVIGKNLGYCFIMMVKPEYVIQFYKTFNGRIFGKKKCKKECNVIWADIQGEDFLKNAEDDPIRKPIIFTDIKED